MRAQAQPQAQAGDPLDAGWIGVARRDITPSYPVRLTGYAARTNLSQGTVLALQAKALALGEDGVGARILVTVDNCGVPAGVVEEVAGRLALKQGIRRGDFAVSSSHTHSGPMVRGFAENIFIRDLTSEEAAASDRYTRELADHLEAVSVAALADRRPGRLYRGEGRVGFAANRRTPGGPVDHSLPILVARGSGGEIRAVVANYACHCTTLGSQINGAHGDWAGYAQQFIESDHPGSVAMITIGCGADSNPSPRGGDDFGITWARTHGRSLATEVKWIADGRLQPVPVVPSTAYRRLWLPFDPLPTREQWEARAKEPAIVGYHARKNLARLDRGEALPTQLPYFVQTWAFGDRLAMVFLAGEVVVDYALRLKREFDPERLWVTGYANDVPCYIPSRRILSEGGYEAESSLWYYDRPARLSGEVEDLIHGAVTNQLPVEFRAGPRRAEFPPPRSPGESLLAMRTAPGLEVELVAAEPLVESPVAVDFGADGRLWVCEMRDYPEGLDGKGTPGGRIKVLTDRDGDGRYDVAKVVVDGLPYPTGLMAWRDGVLVAAAPDVLFVREGESPAQSADTARVERRLSGFATHNFQARVNGLRWGMDGWVYGSGGLFGGRVASALAGREVEGSGRDFRWRPDTGEFEALAGVSQQGRVRDDFGEWFGNDNSTLLWHFPLSDRYSRRVAHLSPPEPRVLMDRDGPRVYPLSRTLNRFNDPHAADQLTSACGPEIYRDDLLGPGYVGNAFVCEPVHNLVRRAVVRENGATFTAHRAPGEETREFLASRDNWFRPVEVRTGPDGALWVVDMYRFVVEHPRWITPDRLRELDVRAGADRGRIYRVRPRGKALRPVADLTRLDDLALVRALETPNGPVRDLVQRRWMERRAEGKPASAALDVLRSLALGNGGASTSEAVRVQAIQALAGTGELEDRTLAAALEHGGPRLARAVLPLAERQPGVLPAVIARAMQAGAGAAGGAGVEGRTGLVFQLCLTLGAMPEAQVGDVRSIAATVAALEPWRSDPWIRAAWQTAATSSVLTEALIGALLAKEAWDAGASASGDLITFSGLLRVLASQGGETGLGRVAGELGARGPASRSAGGAGLAMWLAWEEAVEGIQGLRERLVDSGSEAVRLALRGWDSEGLPSAVAALRTPPGPAADPKAAMALPAVAVPGVIRLLGRVAVRDPAAQGDLLGLLERADLAAHRAVVVQALGRCAGEGFSTRLLAGWEARSPAVRAAILEVLLAREESLEALAEAVEQGRVGWTELSPAQRVRLVERCGEARRERLRARLPGADRTRQEVLRAFGSVDRHVGDPGRGGAHFERLCAACHRVRGKGHAVGPDLGPYAVKPTADYLLAILDPGSAIDPRYAAYEVRTRDGREWTGVVRAETGTSLTLVQGGGTGEVLLRSDIAELRALGTSLMPEGLEEGMSPQDFADLIAWLRTVPRHLGGAGPEAVVAAREAFRAVGASRVMSVASSFAALPYPGWLGTRPLHYCRQTDGKSRLSWTAEALSPGGTAGAAGVRRYRFPAAMGFLSQPAGDFELAIGGRSVLRFGVSLTDARWVSSDGRVTLGYTVQESGTEDSCGILEVEVAVGSDGVGEGGGAGTGLGMAAFSVTGSASASERWFGLYQPLD